MRIIDAPRVGHILNAPPALATTRLIHLRPLWDRVMHAEDGQVHEVIR